MSSWVFLLLLAALASICEGRCRYRESRVRELAIRIPRNCRVKPSVVGEEYWTSVGYDGQLRNGRTTNDFLTLPQSGDGDIRSGWVAYWITKTRYGEGQHYEVFGHAYLRNDGRVCALFAGKNRDVVELCGGFRVLSKNINNPNEELPFEWIQAGYGHPREVLGFHHHRIAKYEWTPEDVFYGDAQLRGSVFHGVSPNSRFYMEMSTPDTFARKVWVLRRKPEVIAAMEAQAGGYPYPYADRRYPESYRHTLSREEDARAYQRIPQPVPVGGGARPEYPSAVGSPYHPGSAERSPFAPYTSQELPPPAAHRPETHPRADAGVHTTSAPHPTNQVRFRYVKPAAVIKDEHGRLYEGHVEGSEAQHHVDSQASADRAGRPQHPAGAGSEAGHHRVAEHPHHAAPQHPHHEAPQHPAPEHPRHVAPQQPHPATRDQWTQEREKNDSRKTHHAAEAESKAEAKHGHHKAHEQPHHVAPLHPHHVAREHATQWILDRSRKIDDYESRRRAHHENYLKQLEERRLEAARRRAEEERRRAQHLAEHERSEEERRRGEHITEHERRQFEIERSGVIRPTKFFKEEEIEEVSRTVFEDKVTEVEEDLNGSVEVSKYPPRLPALRKLEEEELREVFES